MDFGIFNVMQQARRDISSAEVIRRAIEHTRIAEQIGFSRAWYAEHHFSNYSLCPSPLMLATYAAAVTSRIRLGTAVIVPPLYTPARLIGEIAMVDALSGGRLDLGIGSGYQHYEYERFGVDLANAKDMMVEMLDMIEAGLTQPSFSYDGKFYRQPKTAISIRPVQRPHPPIWNSSKEPRLVRRAAQRGYDQYFSTRFNSLDELIPVRDLIDRIFQEEGKDPNAMHLGLLSYGCVSKDKKVVERYITAARYQRRIAQSLRDRRQAMSEDYWVAEQPIPNEPTLEESRARILAGDPETVTERAVEIIRRIRPSHITFYWDVGDVEPKDAIRSMELWVGEVIPGIEKAFGRPIGEINRPAGRSPAQAAD